MQNDEIKSADSVKRGHESRDPHLRNPMIVIGLTVLMVVLCFVAVGILTRSLSQKRPVHSTQSLGQITAQNEQSFNRFSAPNLQIDPAQDLEKLRREDATMLNSYGWVDRSNGIVRIPIERAMDLIAQRGLPTRTNFAEKTNGALRLFSKKGTANE
ncbi:MAG: hypothetical protein ABJC04_04210 [Verrucomicrobiota bacterium]